jgi:diacylglycerol kinase (ATP)
MKKIPQKLTGIKRIYQALFYSKDGFITAFKSETALRQELMLLIISIIVLIFAPFSYLEKLFLIFATIVVLITELLNSAIEAVVDLASPNYHKLAKNAKDIASSAVLLSLLFLSVCWIVIGYQYF